MSEQEFGVVIGATGSEIDANKRLATLLRSCPIPDDELLGNLGMFLTRQTLSKINLIQKIYQLIVPVTGVIMEFGVRWGRNMALFSILRGIYEPFNYNRRIIGFDTFTGFPSVSKQDGPALKHGDYHVVAEWLQELENILNFHEKNAPISHKKKYELVQGDASQTLPVFLANHPETVIACAYFDFDLYKPTKDCLEAILPYVTKGTVLAFDEMNCPDFPGETLAVREVLGLSTHRIQRDPSVPLTSYIVIE